MTFVTGPGSAVDNNIALFDGTSGALIKDGGIAPTGAFGITVDGSGTRITAGTKGMLTMPYSCVITHWYVAATSSGSIEFDIKRSGTSIIGAGNEPGLSSNSSANAAVSGWTSTTITAGDILEFVVTGNNSITNANVVIKATRTS